MHAVEQVGTCFGGACKSQSLNRSLHVHSPALLGEGEKGTRDKVDTGDKGSQDSVHTMPISY